MAETAEKLTEQLTTELRRVLATCEDAESAIDIYKTINWAINQVEAVKQEALDLAEQDMKEKGQEDLRTPTGTAGWTEPRTPQLNEEAWMQAMAKDPNLMRIQREFDLAEAALRSAQQPYLTLPEGKFYIR